MFYVAEEWLDLDDLSLVGTIGVQLLDLICSRVLVLFLMLNVNLLSSQYVLLIPMFYVFESFDW